MDLSTQNTEKVRKGLGSVASWVVSGGLLLALIMTMVQCTVERENTQRAAIQTHNMGRIAAFRDSGAELDKKVAAFNDAAAEGKDLDGPRDAVRAAFADHASRTNAMDDVFGAAETKSYLGAMKALQADVEAAKDGNQPGPIITNLSRVVVARNKLVKQATLKITG
jgi:hypothetical protein